MPIFFLSLSVASAVGIFCVHRCLKVRQVQCGTLLVSVGDLIVLLVAGTLFVSCQGGLDCIVSLHIT